MGRPHVHCIALGCTRTASQNFQVRTRVDIEGTLETPLKGHILNFRTVENFRSVHVVKSNGKTEICVFDAKCGKSTNNKSMVLGEFF